MTTQQLLDLNPQIGTLTRKNKVIYYINFPIYKEAYNPLDLIKSL